MAKLRVAVLMGGKSPEHDVSLVTGKGVVDNLDKRKYQVIPIIISRDGRNWDVKNLKSFSSFKPKIGKQFSASKELIKTKAKDFIFLNTIFI